MHLSGLSNYILNVFICRKLYNKVDTNKHFSEQSLQKHECTVKTMRDQTKIPQFPTSISKHIKISFRLWFQHSLSSKWIFKDGPKKSINLTNTSNCLIAKVCHRRIYKKKLNLCQWNPFLEKAGYHWMMKKKKKR